MIVCHLTNSTPKFKCMLKIFFEKQCTGNICLPGATCDVENRQLVHRYIVRDKFTFSFWKWPGRYPFLTCTNVLCIKIHYAFLVLFLKFYLSPCIYLPEMCFSAACRQFLCFFGFFWLDYSFTNFFSYCCADLNVYIVILLRVNASTCQKTRHKIYKNFAMTKIYIG